MMENSGMYLTTTDDNLMYSYFNVNLLVLEIRIVNESEPLKSLTINSYSYTMLTSLFRPLLQAASPSSYMPSTLSGFFSFQSRNLSKTHRAAYKRWRKTAEGYKRGQHGRKHGNAGFPQRVLRKRSGTAEANLTQSKHLRKLMPNL